MTRVVKQAAERRDEIMDAASRLFIQHGYADTTISDLLAEVGIARGTLYHHFRSKEEVLDGIIRRHGDRILARLQQTLAAPLPAVEQFLACIATLAPQDAEQAALLDELGRAANTALFAKSLDDLVQRIAPVIAEVVAAGVRTGEMHTSYPLAATRILLVSAHSLLDNHSLEWDEAERATQYAALLEAAERVLGIAPGALSTLANAGPTA